MTTSSIPRTLALFSCVLLLYSCTPREAVPEKPQSLTYESIEKGTMLEDARSLLAEKYTELKIGNSPDMDVMIFEDGRQLVFIDGVLTDKNKAAEIDEAVNKHLDTADN